MGLFFLNPRVIIHMDYLLMGRAINGEYCAILLDPFNDNFHRDNAKCAVTMAIIHYYGTRDYFLFPNLKKWLDGTRFDSNDEVILKPMAHYEDFDKLSRDYVDN